MQGKRKRSREGGKERKMKGIKKDDLRIVSLLEWKKGSVHPFPKQGS